ANNRPRGSAPHSLTGYWGVPMMTWLVRPAGEWLAGWSDNLWAFAGYRFPAAEVRRWLRMREDRANRPTRPASNAWQRSESVGFFVGCRVNGADHAAAARVRVGLAVSPPLPPLGKGGRG